ncbi:MAG: NAD(P)/FAD-dependent oxidoreductase [Alphaproteobacteria bacterium]
MDQSFDVVVIGAGAAGMMCAIEAGKRGRRVLILDHASAPGEKIRISGGGRCNFTNIGTAARKNFLSDNPHFCISALSRYTPADFISLVTRHGIAFHEKALGQLFCDDSARQIIDMLLAEMKAAGVKLRLGVSAGALEKTNDGFALDVGGQLVDCQSLVIATGGKSIPKMGATGFAYDVARQFGLRVTETRPALVPLTFEAGLLEKLAALSGVSVQARVRHGGTVFEEGLLFTHRGLSGPAILQISCYWREGDAITIDLAPGIDILAVLREAKKVTGKRRCDTVLAACLPARLAETLCAGLGGTVGDAPDAVLKALAHSVNAWTVKPVGSEGYRTAEVTLGGVDTDDLESKTLAARIVPGLHFIGEAVDVTGWLGGYNFQWAWASGWAAGQVA